MKISREEVLHIAQLARIGLTEDDINNFQFQLSNILENFDILNELDTSNINPTSQTIDLINVFRNDEPYKSYSVDDILSNAPKKDNNYFKLHAVLE